MPCSHFGGGTKTSFIKYTRTASKQWPIRHFTWNSK